jgi:hypothetical protein
MDNTLYKPNNPQPLAVSSYQNLVSSLGQPDYAVTIPNKPGTAYAAAQPSDAYGNSSIDDCMSISPGAVTYAGQPKYTLSAKEAETRFEAAALEYSAKATGAKNYDDLASKLGCDPREMSAKIRKAAESDWLGSDISNLFKPEDKAEDPIRVLDGRDDPLYQVAKDVIRRAINERYFGKSREEIREQDWNGLFAMKINFGKQYATEVVREGIAIYGSVKEGFLHAKDVLKQSLRTVRDKVKSYYTEKYYSFLHHEENGSGRSREIVKEFEDRANLRLDPAMR